MIIFSAFPVALRSIPPHLPTHPASCSLSPKSLHRNNKIKQKLQNIKNLNKLKTIIQRSQKPWSEFVSASIPGHRGCLEYGCQTQRHSAGKWISYFPQVCVAVSSLVRGGTLHLLSLLNAEIFLSQSKFQMSHL